jgi:sugar lactone lactonase YvrE
MYYIGSLNQEIDRFDYDVDSGEISNRTCCIEVPESMDLPDGMCIDQLGRLWVALFGGWCVACWNPDTSELEEYIELPVKKVTSCCFGGEGERTMFITTACAHLSEKEKNEQPHAGNLFCLQTHVLGAPMFYFKG